MDVRDLNPDVVKFLECSLTAENNISQYNDNLYLNLIVPILSKQIEGASEKTILQWTNAFLSSIDTPDTLQGVLLAEPVLKYWVPLFLRTIPSETSLPLEIFHNVFLQLRDLAEKRLDKRLFSRRPRIESAPLFSFHLTAFNSGGCGPRPCSLYRLCSAQLHRGLRKIQATTPEFETFRWYATSARLFFVCFPHEEVRIDSSSLITHEALEAYLKCFTNGYLAHPHKGRRKRELATIAEDHCQRLRRLFREHVVHPRPHMGAITSSESDVTYSAVEDSPTIVAAARKVMDGTHSISTAHVTDRLSGDELSESPQIDADETVSEWILPDAQQPLVRSRPHLPYHYVNRYVLYQYEFWWDSTCLGLHAILPLYQAVEQLRCLDIARFGALGLMLLMPLFSGRNVREYEAAVIARYPFEREIDNGLSPSGLYLDTARKWFFFRQEVLRSSFQQPEASGWLASTAYVPFPIPEPLHLLWNTYLHWLAERNLHSPGSPVLQYADALGNIKPLQVQDIGTLIRESGIKGSQIPNLSELQRGFRGWFIHAFGLDDVTANFVSGRLTRVGPKPRYTHLVLENSHREYQGCCHRLHDLVRSYLPLPGWWSVQSNNDDAPEGRRMVYGIGSPLVPGKTVLREQIQNIGSVITQTASIQKPTDVLIHHNAFVTYVVLALGLLGIRPRNDYGLLNSEFQANVDVIPIIDKLSSLYIEDRLLGLPPTVRHLLHDLAAGRPRLLRCLQMYFGCSTADITNLKSLLLLLSVDGSAIPFSLKGLRECLLNFGLDFLAPAPLNFGRHYNRSAKVPSFAEDLIDFHIGHQRAGREPFCSFGSAFIGQALKLMVNHHESLVSALGFKKLHYFQNGL